MGLLCALSFLMIIVIWPLFFSFVVFLRFLSSIVLVLSACHIGALGDLFSVIFFVFFFL